MAFLSSRDREFWFRNVEDMAQFEKAGGFEGLKVSRFNLGAPENNAPCVVALDLEPGTVLPPHCHDCHRMEVIVRGSMDVGGGRILEAGDVMISEPMQFYGPHVAGPNGCMTMEIFSDYNGSQRTYIKGLDGEILDCKGTTEEGARRMVAHAKKIAMEMGL